MLRLKERRSRSPESPLQRPVRLSHLLLLLLVLACGTSSGTVADSGTTSNLDSGTAPDGGTVSDGGMTPDGGDVAPDGGEVTADGGTTPDAGPSVPVFQARVFNLTNGNVSGVAILNSMPATFISNVPSKQLSEYVNIPVGLSELIFGQSQYGVVPTGSIPADVKIVIVVLTVQGTTVAKSVVEGPNTDATTRHFDFATTLYPLVVKAGAQTVELPQGMSGGINAANTLTEFNLGTSADATFFHFSTARVPEGGRATILAHNSEYYLLGGPGVQKPILTDLQLRAATFSFGLGNEVVFKATTAAGEVSLPPVDVESAASAPVWVAQPVTRITAGGGTQGGTATLDLTETQQDQLNFSEGTPLVVGYGNTAALKLLTSTVNQNNTGFLTIHGLETNIRFRATVMNPTTGQVGTWYPTQSPGYVEPLGDLGLSIQGANSSFKIGFGISNPPNAPVGNAEPVYQLSDIRSSYDVFFYTRSGSWKVAFLEADGTFRKFLPQ